VLNTPLSIDAETGAVNRASQEENVFDEYAQQSVPLKALLD
jgi:hypothetical protein